MAYEVTASRKRPKSFRSLVGQEFVVATLMNALKTRRIAHAYLFSGPRGVGKTSTARILARALNCPDENLLGTDESFDYAGAEEISKGTAMDVIEIDGASNTSVNDIRAIKDEVLFPPQSSRYKIYIIDEVHMLSNSAFNALLKTIEEPPPYIIFIFATTEIHKVPATIRSRCQQFNFRLIPLEKIVELLGEACAELGVTAEDSALFWMARESTGSMRDAYTLLDQVVSFSDGDITLEKIQEKLGLLGIDEMNALGELIVDGNAKQAVEYLDSMFSTGASVEQLIIDMSDYFRGLLFMSQGVDRDGLLGHPKQSYSRKVAEALQPTQLERAIELLLQAYRDIRYSLNSRLELEVVVSKLCRIGHLLEPEEILKRISDLRSQVQSIPQNEAPERRNDSVSKPDQIREIPSKPIKAPEKQSGEVVNSNQTEVQDSGVTQTQWSKIISIIERERPSLAAILSNAREWKCEGNKLILYFDSGLHAGGARNEQRTLQDYIFQQLGTKYDVLVERLESKQEEQSEDPEVQLVKKVFRGDVLQ